MPIPKPRPKEDRQTFVSRCISAVHDIDPNLPNDQIVAIPSIIVPIRNLSTVSSIELAWTAGIIDGEGSLAIGYGKTSRVWFCTVSVRNTDKRMIDKLYELYGGGTFKTKYKYKNEYRPVWTWYIENLRIREFLNLIYPYLVIKQRRAELLIEMRRRIEERVGIEMVYRNVKHGHKSPFVSQNERKMRDELYRELKKYNRSGGKNTDTKTN